MPRSLAIGKAQHFEKVFRGGGGEGSGQRGGSLARRVREIRKRPLQKKRVLDLDQCVGVSVSVGVDGEVQVESGRSEVGSVEIVQKPVGSLIGEGWVMSHG